MSRSLFRPSRRTPSYSVYDGFRLPLDFPRDGFVTGLSYEAQPSDVFVSAYPKCGTTWTLYIVWLVLHDGEPLPADREHKVDMPHLEEVGSAVVEALPEPRIIKTHLPHSMTPYHPQARYIYVTRNPFDCAVSFFHHTQGFVDHYDFADGTFADFFECFLSGEVDFGDYFDNVLSWYARRADDNVLFLTYEGMQRDPRNAILEIADFLGPSAQAAMNDPAVLEKVLRHSSFDSMSRDQARWSSRRAEQFSPFVRKGVVGDWTTTFSADQAERLSQKFAARTQGTELGQLWEGLIPGDEDPRRG